MSSSINSLSNNNSSNTSVRPWLVVGLGLWSVGFFVLSGWDQNQVAQRERRLASASSSSYEFDLPLQGDSDLSEPNEGEIVTNPYSHRDLIETTTTLPHSRYEDWRNASKGFDSNGNVIYRFFPWVDKIEHYANETRTDDDPHQVCLVHVGKAAGCSVGCSLGFNYNCPWSSSDAPISLLSRATTHLMHNNINDCHNFGPYQYYMFTARNPFHRIQSWFEYEFPYDDSDHYLSIKKPLYIDCGFNRLQQLAELGLAGQTSIECHKRAWDAILGRIGFAKHNAYNYRYFYSMVLNDNPNPRIAILRTEHLVQDWQAMERVLYDEAGGDNVTDHDARPLSEADVLRLVGKPKNRTSRPDPNSTQADLKMIKRELSPEASRWLCLALCEEIQVYKHLLMHAVNLTPENVHESMNELHAICPYETTVKDCPAPPHF